jgi:hypothetical protein
MMDNPLYEKQIATNKPHWLCKLLGHKYESVVWIETYKKSITGYSVCKRCRDVSGTTTFGPFDIVI